MEYAAIIPKIKTTMMTTITSIKINKMDQDSLIPNNLSQRGN